ncbi:hypothetical protein A9Q82_07480 [Cycloclasticus sp. 46_120_T64]|nr:hypothetical protein A9Q82_07480 [Cycloclasticus sp. 46_120_T64]
MRTAARHLEYLDAMGVQVWFDRRVTPQASNVDGGSVQPRSVEPLFFSGSLPAQVMVISAFPSSQDVQQVSPFSGDSARLLAQMLQALGLQYDECYLINSADMPATGDSQLDKQCLAECRAYLLQQIHEVSPKVILLLGEAAAQSLLKSSDPLVKLTADQPSVDDIALPMVVTQPLEGLLQQPLTKKQSWSELQRLKEFL